MRTFLELYLKYRRQGIDEREANRLAQIDKLKDSIAESEERLASIREILRKPDLKDRDRRNLEEKEVMIGQFLANDKELLKRFKNMRKKAP